MAQIPCENIDQLSLMFCFITFCCHKDATIRLAAVTSLSVYTFGASTEKKQERMIKTCSCSHCNLFFVNNCRAFVLLVLFKGTRTQEDDDAVVLRQR